MKRLLTFSLLIALASSLTAAENLSKFANYEAAMKSDKNHPMAVEWHTAKGEEVEDATTESVLAAFVSDEESAKALLDQIRSAYTSDPIVMTQIAAVTQWVMTPEPCAFCFWKPSPAAGRKVWVAALKAKIASSDDIYVKTFCQQQLDLCR